MIRKLSATVAVAAMVLAPSIAAPAQTRPVPVPRPHVRPLHDFDLHTLQAYVNLRFSMAVPRALIRRILATERFSARDLRLLREARPATRGSTPKAPASTASIPARVRRARVISRDHLRCPKSDSTPCERDTEAEPHIAVNPAAPRNIVGAFQMGRYRNGGAVDTGWTTSLDGGKTWPYRGAAPGLTVQVSKASPKGPGAPFERASDPVVAFDHKHHVVLLQSIGVSVKGCAIYCDSALTMNISRNKGKSFGPPVIVHENFIQNDPTHPSRFNDKNWIAVDNFHSSSYYGREYSSWDQVRCPDNGCNVAPIHQPVMVTYSDDGGRHWSAPVVAANENPGSVHQEVGVQPLVLPNGHVVIVYPDVRAGVYTFEGQVKAVRSTDGGRHWSKPVLIDNAAPHEEEDNNLRAPNIPSAAVGSNGTIWVAWQDQRFGPGRNDIVLTHSSDEGRHWSQLINATPGEQGIDHFSPAIAVVRRTIHMTYRTHAPVSVYADPAVGSVYRKIRRGKTVAGPTALYKPSDSTYAAFVAVAGAAPLKFYGDYEGIAATGKVAHPIWTQAQKFRKSGPNATNTHQRAMSARVLRRRAT